MKKIYAALVVSVIVSAVSAQPVLRSDETRIQTFQIAEEFGTVKLRFNTIADPDIVSHEIQRSTNGIDFTSIAVLSPELNNRTDFFYTDATPLQGTNYYRIRSVGYNRTEYFSAVRKAEFGTDKTEVLLMPNPVVTRELRVQLKNFEAGQYAIELFNAAGTKLYSKNISQSKGTESETINLPENLSAGVYTLHIKGKNFRMNKTIQVIR